MVIIWVICVLSCGHTHSLQHLYVPIFSMPVTHKSDGNTSTNSITTISSAGNWQYNLLIPSTDLNILVVTYFTWSLNVRFSSSATPRILKNVTFVRIESQILISIVFFWLEIIIHEVLLTLRESLLVLSQLSTPTSSLFTVAWTLLMSLLDAKPVVSSAKWQNASDLRIYTCHWYTKERVLGPTPSLVEHPM